MVKVHSLTINADSVGEALEKMNGLLKPIQITSATIKDGMCNYGYEFYLVPVKEIKFQHVKDPKKREKPDPVNIPYYWLDIGNLQKTGQCVLGTLHPSYPPANDKTAKRTLKNVVQKFPQLKRIKEEIQGPSCSLAEALEKQDLFINSTIAQFGCNLIWKLIREGSIRYHGCYVNLETLTVNPIKI
ncbi:MAG: hypothetical protein KA954_01410 [Chitinophagales bacterium]|nr:hypothetical protein [Chitinophagales bacterium]MBP9845808.1 hypothetical protein [Saprospiraceae bacterium]